jgi:surface antigen
MFSLEEYIMQKSLTKIAVLCAALSLTACSTNTQTENTGIGALAGGAIGGVTAGLLGGNAAAVGVSIIGGALIGGIIGHSMDSSDKTMANAAITSDKPVRWQNSRTKTTYTIVPSKHYITVNGNPHCRNYTTTAVTIDNKTTITHSTACLRSDGKWEVVKS